MGTWIMSETVHVVVGEGPGVYGKSLYLPLNVAVNLKLFYKNKEKSEKSIHKLEENVYKLHIW